MIRVLIVDDHRIVRGSLKHIVQQAADLVAEEASSGLEALKMLATQPPDVVLLDISLPDLSGIEVLRRMQCLCPKVPALVLSVSDEGQYASHVLRAGAAGFLNKGEAPDELVRAIREVISGHRYISTAQAARLSIETGSGDPGSGQAKRARASVQR